MNDWISVEDRLPSKVDFWLGCLVYVKSKMQMGQINFAYYNQDGFTVTDESGNHADFITHWMPLPKPPEPKT